MLIGTLPPWLALLYDGESEVDSDNTQHTDGPAVAMPQDTSSARSGLMMLGCAGYYTFATSYHIISRAEYSDRRNSMFLGLLCGSSVVAATFTYLGLHSSWSPRFITKFEVHFGIAMYLFVALFLNVYTSFMYFGWVYYDRDTSIPGWTQWLG